jgi:hypothetical protein
MNLHKHHPRNNKKAGRYTFSSVCHPSKPQKGDGYFVQTGSQFFGENFTITRVNRRSFYYYHAGQTVRRLVVEWEQWVDELFEIGFVFFDGTSVLPPARLTPPPVEAGSNGRQKRFDRALSGARDLLRRPCIGEPRHSRKERRFKVSSGPASAVTVTVPDSPIGRITCVCADFKSGGPNSQYACCHIFVVLLVHASLKHRVLDYLL